MPRRRQDRAAELAGALAGGVAGIVIADGDIGTVPAVAGFVSAAQAARDAQAAGARAESARRADLGLRVSGTADLGERLLVDTEAIARAGAPGPVPFGDGTEVLRPPG